MKRYSPVAIILLVLAPSLAFADGVSPILNFFHKETWLPASIVTLVIVVLEAGFLNWRIKTIRFGGALWRSGVINVASSITGSVILLAFSRDSFFIWDTMAFVLPLFIITILTEIPLMRVLFRTYPLSWGRACVLGFGINVASYVAVFVLEIGLLVGWLSYAGHLDKRELAEWSNPQLLLEATGVIYATESTGAKHGLRVFGPREGTWTSLTNCPSLDPIKWDVEGRTCAFVRTAREWEDRNLLVVTLPGFVTVLEIPPDTFADSCFNNWQGVTDVAISPDQKRLAVLFRFTEAVAPKDNSGYYDLGGKCRLIVIDLESGQETARASRWASDHGLCWLPDSHRILFPSFDDEVLYRTTRPEVRGSTSYGIGYARDGRFKRSLYSFDVNSGDIARFSDGYAPSVAGSTGQILVRHENGMLLLDGSGNVVSRVNVSRLGFREAVISPSGALLLVEMRRHAPFHGAGRLTIMSLNAPDIRHVLDDRFLYRADWTLE